MKTRGRFPALAAWVAVLALGATRAFAQEEESVPPPPPPGEFDGPPPDMIIPPEVMESMRENAEDRRQPSATPAPRPRAWEMPRASDLPTSTTMTAQPGDLTPDGKLRFNFRGVPIDTVLDYMSRAAGFVIVRSVSVSGRVDVVSQKPLTADEAVTLLNSILNEKGYAAVRNERILTIVSRDDARTRSIPVIAGGDPALIPNNEQMVTQVIPVRHAKVKELVENLEGLLPSYARISSNESSNSIVLTDTQSSIRRVAEIVQALDQSISEISALKVYPLHYSDAKDTADLINKIFAQQTTGSSNNRDNVRQFFSQFRGGGGRGGDNNNSEASADSAALQASSRVLAAADERTNSVVVSAPDNVMTTIDGLIASIDMSTDVLTEVRVFPLRNSNATEMAAVVSSIFGDQAQTASSGQNQGRQRFFNRFGGGGGNGGGNNQQGGAQSEREQAENQVLAVADTRTNSIVVSATNGVMQQVADVVTELDKNPAKVKRVYTYSLSNANPEDVATMLEEMFGSSGTSTTNRNTTNRNTNNNANRNTGGSNNNTNRNSNNQSSRNNSNSNRN